MKKILATMMTCLMVMALVTSCSGKSTAPASDDDDSTETVAQQEVSAESVEPQLSETNPEDVARMLLDGLVAKDVAKVEKYIGTRRPHKDAMFLVGGTEYYGGFKSYEILETKVNGNTATVKYLVQFGNGESQKDRWELVKQSDGTWKTE